MVRIEALDIGGGICSPVRKNAGLAAVAARLVGELPGEDRGGVGVARYDGFDVGFVLGLRCRVGVPGCLAASEGGYVLEI